MNTRLTRRTLLTAGAAVSALALAACGKTEKIATPESPATPTGEGVYTRSADGFHLNSKVEAPTVVLYSDFQCPYCAKAEPTYMEAAQELNGVMNVTVKNFPLPMHANAVPAALAVEAAEAQGKHVEMVQLVFEHQDEWKDQSLEEARTTFRGYAEELGLDLEKYTATFEDNATLKLVEKDFESGRAVGVSGTPQWVVGGTVVESVDSSTSKDDMVAAFKEAANLS
ncbi:thioredoxin domain-containing protein [Rothia sp. ZJ932]|uniref:DsbA family protein n=1 Tax=Rothia sp. ZJ932 TaxID=2810516 RepID=UPI001967621C|nr:thioredoxin domain-containing protein [Rothia sp. ZJ932]QRZ61857.1 thioredoxin domain-containing protein [Rothia sp. ZJ932]